MAVARGFPPRAREVFAFAAAATLPSSEATAPLFTLRMPIGYADPKYWEALYSGHDREAVFEWYMSAQQLSPLLWPLLPAARPADVLEMGCGTQSLLPGLRALHAASFRRLLATDLSAAGINKLAATVDPAIECAVADCRSTGLAALSWDLILDKATCDALLTQGSSNKGHADVAALGREAARLLRAGGCLVVVTHAQPELHLCGDGEEPPPEHDARPLIDALLLGVCEGAPFSHWSVEAHVPDPDDCPRVLILRKRERRSSRGRRPPPMAARDVRCRLVEGRVAQGPSL
jgi:SAM-dependent methyltransferase